MTGVDGQSRASDDSLDCPLQVRYEQKVAKDDRVAGENNLRFTPAIFLHNGQIHGSFTFKRLIKEQICGKLICLKGGVKQSKVKSAMKWWSKSISFV